MGEEEKKKGRKAGREGWREDGWEGREDGRDIYRPRSSLEAQEPFGRSRVQLKKKSLFRHEDAQLQKECRGVSGKVVARVTGEAHLPLWAA